MSKKGTEKTLSTEHEKLIARVYQARHSPSSGAAPSDQGDVRQVDDSRPRDALTLFECKRKGAPGTEIKGTPSIVKQMEKIADEAWSEGREPALALRFWLPDSRLAKDGWVDLTVRLLSDDVARDALVRGMG